MAKTVFKGRGTLVSGVCPNCPEVVSVFLRENEPYRNSRCNYCGSKIYGDGISGMIREGHYVSLIPQHQGREVSVKECASFQPDIAEYDRKRQEELQEMSRQHLLFEIPHHILKMTRRDVSG